MGLHDLLDDQSDLLLDLLDDIGAITLEGLLALLELLVSCVLFGLERLDARLHGSIRLFAAKCLLD